MPKSKTVTYVQTILKTFIHALRSITPHDDIFKFDHNTETRVSLLNVTINVFAIFSENNSYFSFSKYTHTSVAVCKRICACAVQTFRPNTMPFCEMQNVLILK